MKVRRKVKPGQPGTKRLMELYGSNLVCVRYRYDVEAKKRYITAEIIIDEAEWVPKHLRFEEGEIVVIRIPFEDADLQKKVRQAGGRWDGNRCVWKLRYDQAVILGLQHRVEKEFGSNSRSK